MTRSDRIVLRRWQKSRRRTTYLLASIGDVWARMSTESVGAAMDRFRRRPKWAKSTALGYVQDAMGELLGEEPSPFIFLVHENPPIPECVLAALRDREPIGKSWHLDVRDRETPAWYAKLYYGIVNHTGDEAAAAAEIRRFIMDQRYNLQLLTLREATRDPRIVQPWEASS